MELEDVDNIANWFVDLGDVALFDRSLPIPVSSNALRESWRASMEYSPSPSSYWVVVEDPERNPAGLAGMNAINFIHGDAIVPAFVGEEFRNLGLGPAMAVYLINLAFDHFRLHRLTTFYRVDNAPSEKVLTRVGFEKEGLVREGWFANGTRYDVVTVGLLASRWSERKSAIIDDVAQSCDVPLPPAFWDRLRG